MSGSAADDRPLEIVLLPNNRWSERGQTGAQDGKTMVDALREQGHQVTIIEPTRAPWCGFPRDAFMRGFDPLRALRVLFGHRRADAVISTFEPGIFFLALMRRLFLFRPKLIMWEVNVGTGWAFRDKVIGLTAPRVDAVLTLSDGHTEALKREFPRTRRAIPIYSARDLPPIDAVPEPAERKRQILLVGEDAGRDIDVVIDALDRIDLPLLVKSRRAARKLAPLNRDDIEIVDGFLDFPEFIKLYKQSTMAMITLDPVPYPSGITSLLEAMAARTPVIVTDTRSLYPFIQHGKTAHLIPPHDPEALVEAVEKLDSDPDYARSLAENARRMIETDYRVEARAADMARIIRTL